MQVWSEPLNFIDADMSIVHEFEVVISYRYWVEATPKFSKWRVSANILFLH
jgi:hypothetical protein